MRYPSTILLIAALASGCCAAGIPAGAAKPLFGAYKFLPLGLAAREPLPGGDLPAPSTGTITWAFATGECGQEAFGGRPGVAVAAQTVGRFESAGVDFLVSTGGEGGSFTCHSDEGMEDFLSHYASPRFRGVDLDIEADPGEGELETLLSRLARARQRHPGLRVSLTLATLAASDGSGAGLNALGRRVLRLADRAGLHDPLVNLMVMDFGEPATRNCVVADGACDMARSAIQAVRNLHERLGIELSRIEVTAMIGVNDTPGNRFGLFDATRLASSAREMGLAGVHYWSMDRDKPCEESAARPDCSGIPDAPRGAFAQAFGVGLRNEENRK